MRVTNNMLNTSVVFNIQRSLSRYLELQTEMSSGRRINSPSDDPVGTIRDLDYRTELSKISQYQKNISESSNWGSSYDNILADLKNTLQDAKEVAIAMSDDTTDAVQRNAGANEVRALIERVIQLANTRSGGRQMFSGFRTQVKPLQVGTNGVRYMGDNGQIEVEIESAVKHTLNLNGADTFLTSLRTLGEDGDWNVGVVSDTLLTDLHAAGGIDLTAGSFTIIDANMNGVSTTVDLNGAPPATTVGEALTKINDALTAAGMNAGVAVTVGDDGNNLKVDVTSTGQVSTATRLEDLRTGLGIDLEAGTIRVTDGGPINIDVDLSSATTLGDVISSFNLRMAGVGLGNVTMDINAAGTGLQVVDSSMPSLGLSVVTVADDGSLAEDLGIAGDISGTLVGADLEPRPRVIFGENGGSTAADLGLLGTFASDRNGDDLDPALGLTAEIANLRNGHGFDGDGLILYQGERSLVVDLTDPSLVTVQDFLDTINDSGLDVIASLNSSGTGIQIVNDDPNRSFMIAEMDEGRAAKQMDLSGSSDMMGSLLALANALEDNDRETIGMLLDNLDMAMTQALDTRAQVGTDAMRLEMTSTRLTNLHLDFTRLLSEVEDADLTQVLTDLTAQENAYRAALMASSELMQQSLLDFMR